MQHIWNIDYTNTKRHAFSNAYSREKLNPATDVYAFTNEVGRREDNGTCLVSHPDITGNI